MKAMQPSMFWALARHIQHCGHPIYIDILGYNTVHIKLATDDVLHVTDLSHPFNCVGPATAKALCAQENITHIVERDQTQCQIHT